MDDAISQKANAICKSLEVCGMSEHEKMIDLEILVSMVGDLPKDFVKQVRHLRDWHSALADLRIANDQAHTLVRIFDQANVAEVGSDIQNPAVALFNSSVMLYSRATNTRSDHRVTFEFRSFFDDLEKEVHSVICGIRDDGIAHFGPSVKIQGFDSNSDGVFAVWNVETGETQLLMASRRGLADAPIIHILARQTNRAVIIAFRETGQRENKVLRSLIDLCTGGQITAEAMLASCVDLSSFIHDDAAVRSILRGPRHGAVTGMATLVATPPP